MLNQFYLSKIVLTVHPKSSIRINFQASSKTSRENLPTKSYANLFNLLFDIFVKFLPTVFEIFNLFIHLFCAFRFRLQISQQSFSSVFEVIEIWRLKVDVRLKFLNIKQNYHS